MALTEFLGRTAQFSALATVLPPTLHAPAPDRFRYRLTVEGPAGAHTVVVDEAALPESLRALIAWVEATGKP